jgi:hypothetical protein
MTASSLPRDGHVASSLLLSHPQGITLDCDATNGKLRDVYTHFATLRSPSGATYKSQTALALVEQLCPKDALEVRPPAPSWPRQALNPPGARDRCTNGPSLSGVVATVYKRGSPYMYTVDTSNIIRSIWKVPWGFDLILPHRFNGTMIHCPSWYICVHTDRPLDLGTMTIFCNLFYEQLCRSGPAGGRPRGRH